MWLPTSVGVTCSSTSIVICCTISPGPVASGRSTSADCLYATRNSRLHRPTTGSRPARGGTFEVNLPEQTITSPDGTKRLFGVNELIKRSLIEGLDDISLTLRQEPDIAAFQSREKVRRPWIYDVSAH